MYKILFIDEEQDSFDNFKNYVDKFSNMESEIEVVTEFPLKDIPSMIHRIIEINPDALVTDFMLNENKEYIKYNVSYNGSELVEHFKKIRELFPCFVLTAFDSSAIDSSEDVNIVYVKHILHNKEEQRASVKFINKILMQINHYKNRIEKMEKRLIHLINLNEKEKNIGIEAEIIEIDSFLEKTIDRKNAIPKELKKISNQNKLNELIKKTDRLIAEIKKKNEK